MIGDELLSINGESVLNKPLSEAIKLLQQSGQLVQLRLCRKITGINFDLCHIFADINNQNAIRNISCNK